MSAIPITRAYWHARDAFGRPNRAVTVVNRPGELDRTSETVQRTSFEISNAYVRTRRLTLFSAGMAIILRWQLPTRLQSPCIFR